MDYEDALDTIVVYSLQDYYNKCAEPDKIDCSDDVIEPDEEILNSIKVVLSHYMSLPDYEKWLEKADGKN